MYPIMVKIDFADVMKAGQNIKPVALTLFVNWAILVRCCPSDGGWSAD
jgi:ACR3 family arsenite transporter